MSVISLTTTAIGNPQTPAVPSQRDTAAIKKMAAEFEAVMLNQLTAALNPKDDDEDGALFTNSGGLGLSRQMFGEQMAKTMSEGGGIGLADLILKQVNQKAGPILSREAVHALAAAKDPRASSATRFTPTKALAAMKEIGAASATRFTPTRVAAPATSAANEKYPDAVIISEADSSASIASPGTFATENRVVDVSSATVVANATRPRRVNLINSPAVTATVLATEDPLRHVAVPGATEIRPMGTVALHLPIRGSIRSVFGPRRDPINGRQRFHEGIDIAAKRGTPIEAAADGKVIFAGKNKGYGNMVMIEHADGRRTVYAHAEHLFVRAGATVRAGETIAAVGSTGHSTGPHLHFEVREGNKAVNPLAALSNELTLASR